MGFRQIIFEGDAQTIVKEVNSESPCTSLHGQFVEGIQSKMKALEEVQFNYVKRGANNVAHWLAKLATTLVTDETWMDSVPPVICVLFEGKKTSLISDLF
jgi:hypothetical protein